MTSPRLLPALLVAAVVGCSDDGPKPSKDDEETPAVIPSGQGAASNSTSDRIVRPKIPDDIFFKDPLAIANNVTRIGGDPQPATAAAHTPVVSDSEPPAAAPEAVDWEALLPEDLLVAEVARIRERLEPKLSSVANFNSSLLDFPPYAAELAALGGIATQHPGAIPWKANAKYVRDLSAAMTVERLQRGQKSYDQVKQPFEKVVSLLDGQIPDDLPEADDETDFAVAADFGYLMQRFEAGQNAVQATGGSESAFKQNAANLAREARVLAALSKVIASDDYGYGDDDKFQGFATAMTQAALDAAGTAESGDYAKFDLSFNALGQSCNACHGEYRNN